MTTSVRVKSAPRILYAYRTKYDYSVSHHNREEDAHGQHDRLQPLRGRPQQVLRLRDLRRTVPGGLLLDENGFVVANMTEIPDQLMPAVEEAVYCCPENVLSIRKSGE